LSNLARGRRNLVKRFNPAKKIDIQLQLKTILNRVHPLVGFIYRRIEMLDQRKKTVCRGHSGSAWWNARPLLVLSETGARIRPLAPTAVAVVDGIFYLPPGPAILCEF
jgi:hypothetical protein